VDSAEAEAEVDSAEAEAEDLEEAMEDGVGEDGAEVVTQRKVTRRGATEADSADTSGLQSMTTTILNHLNMLTITPWLNNFSS